MHKKTVIVTACLFIVIASFATDSIIVHKDSRLDIFTVKQAAVNKLTSKMTSSGQYRGYRLQLLNTRSREEAFKLKSNFLQMYPSQQAYVVYQSPYFKVRIGNFMQREDAIAFKNKFSKSFPQTVYVVEDVIEYTPREINEPVLN